MHLSTFLVAAAAAVASAATINRRDGVHDGPEIWGSHNEIDECEMHQAIECLHSQICVRRKVPYRARIRCTIGSSVAYVCNYKNDFTPKDHAVENANECDESEMYEAWRQIRIAKASQTGWWYSKKDEKTYGFDRRCPDNECDSGRNEGSEGEQCTNIQGVGGWLFDYVGERYPNFTAEFIQPLPEIGDLTEPMYFNPWYEGRRPK
ncbi:hypothetical protein B0T16DRAFT_333811 [Cercophora newfieldiana]|uniref:Uncharacterized protein n=1 Tax=Cercophora newfieldiana TaxID=92897 RepID=A0AA39Y1K6_9PEZI|nr:hypothetical protein B0T16DRAFT_333811 [Cercophora newfieldiana]